MTYLHNGWTSKEKKICTHNSLQLSSTLGYRILYWGVHLTKGQPAQSSTNLGHKMSLHRGRGMGGRRGHRGSCVWGGVHLTKVILPKVVPNLAMRCLYQGVGGGTSDQKSAWPEVVPLLVTRFLYWGVCLTKHQSDLK